MDGFQFMEQLQKDDWHRKIPVVLIAPDSFRENEVKGMGLGASDVIIKPFDPVVVRKRVENIISLFGYRSHMEEMVEQQTKNITETNNFIVDALSTVIEYRNLESGLHIRRIRIFTKTLLKAVARSYLDSNLTQRAIATITRASAMHDIGKIAIPDAVLLKPGRLTPEEFKVMQTHTTKGCDILQAFHRMEDKEYLRYSYEICRHHHERWDGRGYPDGLAGDAIPLCAQVVAIADVYDALTSPRVYKAAIPHKEAVRMIFEGECGAFSEKMLRCFSEVSDRFEEISIRHRDGVESPGTPPVLETVGKTEPEMSSEQIAAKLMEASASLRKETLQRDALIHAIPGGVANIILNKALTVKFASNGFYALTGYNSTEFQSGLPAGGCAALIPQQERAILLKNLCEQASEGGRVGAEFRIRRKDGGYAWVDLHGTILESDDGTDTIQAVLIDTTQGKQAEQKLVDLMNSVPGGIALVRIQDDLTIQFASEGFYQISGYTRDEYEKKYSGAKVLNIIHPDDLENLKRHIWTATANGDERVTLEYRVICKDGSTAWHQVSGTRTVGDGDGVYYQCVFTDVTESKAVRERLKLNEERYRIIVEQAQDVIFEWDIVEDYMYFSPMFKRRYGYDMPAKNFRKRIMESDIVCEEDKQVLRKHFEHIKNGTIADECELRIKAMDGGYIWCRIKVTVLFNNRGRPVHSIGVLSDIDAYKRENALLEARTQRDLLTGLYNKNTLEGLVDDFLKSTGKNGRHALFFLDVDNFKAINNQIGHSRGDEVLSAVSKGLRENFREEDILGRVGGDEFVILLKNAPSCQVSESKAHLLREMFAGLTINGCEKLTISGSIGVSVYPLDGTRYQDLFESADQALAIAKRENRGSFVVYGS